MEKTSDPSTPGLAPYNVVAMFAEGDPARDAILELERSGIDGDRISVLGCEAEDTRAPGANTGGEDDTALLADAGAHAVKGMGAGAIIGALGAAAVSIAVPGVGPFVGAGLLGAALGGGALGGATGGFANVVANTSAGPAWREIFAQVREGRILVATHLDDPDDVYSAHRVFDDAGAARVLDVDSKGNPVEAPIAFD